MSKFFYILLLCFCSLTISCITPEITDLNDQKEENIDDAAANNNNLINYNEALNILEQKILKSLKNILDNKDNSINKTIFFKNLDIKNNEETELSKRFISDIIAFLINNGINIKRYEYNIFQVENVTDQNEDCKDILSKLFPDYFLNLSFKECAQSGDCIEAWINLISSYENNVIFNFRQTFLLQDNTKKWNQELKKIPQIKGSEDNPYIDFNQASEKIISQIQCIFKEVSNSSDYTFTIAKTHLTEDIYSNILKNNMQKAGLNQIFFDKAPLISINQKRFNINFDYLMNNNELNNNELNNNELNNNELKNNELKNNELKNNELNNCDFLLAIDFKESKIRKNIFKLNVIALKDIPINYNGKEFIVSKGEIFPGTDIKVYILSTFKQKVISARGIGNCNKNMDKAIWAYSAKVEAESNARKELTRILKEIIITNNNDLYLTDERIQLSIRTGIRNARLIWEQFYEDKCQAEAVFEIHESDMHPFLKIHFSNQKMNNDNSLNNFNNDSGQLKKNNTNNIIENNSIFGIIKFFEDRIVKMEPGWIFKKGKKEKIMVACLDINLEKLRESGLLESYRQEHNELKHSFSLNGKISSWIPDEKFDAALSGEPLLSFTPDDVKNFMKYNSYRDVYNDKSSETKHDSSLQSQKSINV